ncbi:MAG: oligosaccharide flippase family protein [Planctomycetes bacterium]|nr:oligosaccharide flippase family protein [Planctomycetota bacterium]
MTTETIKSDLPSQEGVDIPGRDLTGQDRMIGNIFASWGTQFVYLAAGFILPRAIRSITGSDVMLGWWDFGWSLVAYFSLVNGGVTSSVNRYVAKYRSVGDTKGVNEAVSSVTYLLFIMGIVVALLSVAVAIIAPWLLAEKVGALAGDVKWMILLLGLGMAVQTALSSYGGVVTGCHRWGWQNAVYAVAQIGTVVGIVAVLLVGGRLASMAIVVLAGELVCRVWLVILAYRFYPGLKVRLSLARWGTAREMLAFGIKTFIPRLGELLANQTVSIILLSWLGPASLAFFSRPGSLVRNLRTFVARFSFVLVPTVSSLQAANQHGQLQDLFVKASRYSAYLVLPIVLALTILGGPLIMVWMGSEKYNLPILTAVLALGQCAFVIQLPIVSVLTGMNAHGRAGLANFVASACAVVLALLAVGPLGWGLVGAAVAVAIPLTVANAFYIPLHACRRLDIPVARYFRQAYAGPILCTVPYCLCLVAVRVIFNDRPKTMLLSAAAAGAVVLAITYWRSALPPSFKSRLSDGLRRFIKRVR